MSNAPAINAKNVSAITVGQVVNFRRLGIPAMVVSIAREGYAGQSYVIGMRRIAPNGEQANYTQFDYITEAM